MFKKLRQCLAISLIGATSLVGNAHAGYSNLVFFGDSLSDTGNVLSLTTAVSSTPFPNYLDAPGRFSNGPSWTEYLAAGLGLANSANPSNLIFNGTSVVPIGAPGGQNYSFGGARTGLSGAAGATTGLFGQLVAWNGSLFGGALTRAADPNALYVVMAGANDLRDARTAASGNTPADAAARAAAAATTAQNIVNALGLLAQAGAQHFLISNLPDLGKTPESNFLGNTLASTDVTLDFNASLAQGAAGLDAFFFANTGIDLDIRTLDFFGLNNAVFDDALNNGGARYGITNVSAPCINPVAPGAYFSPGSSDINCSVSAFSDALHPSAASHALLGQLALSTVPEPGTVALVLLGMVMVVGVRRRTRVSPSFSTR
jgi:phospholipase/lecithinase/hemolysin